MDSQSLFSRITMNPKLLLGKLVIRGLRITVEQILKTLANGVPIEQLLKDYPELELEDIRASLAYAVNLVAEQKAYLFEVA